eukprot:COSAG03_NODE_14332_length_468_cov_0.747967_1_plen_109_part_01
MPAPVTEKQRDWLKKASRSRGRSSFLGTLKGVSALVFLQRECQARGLAPNGSKPLLAEQLARFELGVAPVEDPDTQVAFALNEVVQQLELNNTRAQEPTLTSQPQSTTT